MSSSQRPDAGQAAMQAVIDSLPVTEHRERIVEAIRQHPVVIVSGETGSGKTTQLPKFALEAGRGQPDPKTGRGGLVGHTQPRRIAASSVATRIAEELGTPLGTDVGYKIRFNEKTSPGTRIKLMTDGILLAESQRDRLLSAYDTLIIDEAHERSLNIDFLLGYLKQLIDGPRRHDLKLIITSATIDAARFAVHFGDPGRPAPVIEVSGRLYPVEVRYRPPEALKADDEDDETDLPGAVEAAIEELWNEKAGDVLVFLPGEREIRDCTEHLRRAQQRQGQRAGGGRSRAGLLLASAEIVPLYARLPAADQQRVFNPGQAPRIVLATNVAETSLTVPRIRYVVDSGLARMLRYRIRGKVDQLLIEPVSRAAANQRAGRCGRVAEGVCVRLFDEKDFLQRPAFTDPEILRSSLASVILRMAALGLSEVSAFPFLDRPSPKAIADGYALLAELGAMDERQQLTPIGRQLARLPVDPRLARMLLAGHRSGCLAEVLVITAALSVQDPRERPPTAQQAADQAHARFNVPGSDFLAWLRLWRYWQAQQAGRKQRGESHRALANRMGREFLSIRRLREWADVIGQLSELVRGLNWQLNTTEATPDVIHQALLTGLLGNIAHRLPEGPGWQGTHQQKFVLHPSSILNRRQAVAPVPGANPEANTRKSGARWLMAAEMVDTGRLQARTAAAIKPEWIETAAADLIKRSWSNPHWEKRNGKVMAQERGVLYGVVLYAARRVPYERIDPAGSRMLMIRHGLVAGEWPDEAPFIRHNRKVVAEIERLEHKIRRPDLLIDEEALVAWFDQQIPADICNARQLQQWWRQASQDQPGLLCLSREALLRKDADGVDEQRFPRLLRMHGVDFSLGYHFEPGSSDDGVTLTVPLHALNQVDGNRCEWLVPGMLATKVALLLKSLPQRWRRHLLPLDRTAEAFVEAKAADSIPAGTPLIEALLDFLRQRASGVRISAADFRTETVPAHLHMNFRLVNEHGRVLAVSRQLSQLQAAYGSRAQNAFQAEFSRVAAQVNARQTAQAGRKDGAAATQAADADGAARGAEAPAAPAAMPGRRAGESMAGHARPKGAAAPGPADAVMRAGERHLTWAFGALPELLEIEARDGHRLMGYPALLDKGDAVELGVFDDPAEAARQHRRGVIRLLALAMSEAVKAIGRDVRKNASLELGFAQLPGGQTRGEGLAEQLARAAIDRSFLAQGVPQDAQAFETALADGRPRLMLTAQEFSRLLQQIVTEHGQIRRKLSGFKADAAALADIDAQLAGLFPPGFLHRTPFGQLAHYPRYLKAIGMRLDKLRSDPARDRQQMSEMAPLLQRWRQWQRDVGMRADREAEAFRWLLEELRVSLFAQSLRTPMPVSVKRLNKVLDQRH
ncbi:MAG: ATP-dependent RNA helicase HrpA [Lautropia sp.]|nr:ATP-dependent RNA helicase HrpA [Lautropia sp.]